MSHALETENLFKRGFKQAAFSQKSNAAYFKHLWQQKGYNVETIKSSGPTVEHPNKRVTNAYYVVATKSHNAVHGTNDVTKKIINKFI